MSRAPYQFIPTAVYDEDERRKKADAWAEQHRQALAAQWRDLHAQDAADLLRQHGLDEMGMPLGSDPNTTTAASPTQDIPTAASPADSFSPPSPAPAADVLQKVGDAGGLAPPSFDEVMQKATLPGEGISDAAMGKTLTGEPSPDEQRSPFDLPTPDLPGLPLNGPRVLPPQFGKPTQIGDEQRDKMLAGQPLTAQDVASQFLKASNNNQFQSSPAGLAGGGDLDQILHPRLADLAGAPGVHLGTSEEDLARGFAQGLSEGAGVLGDARSAAEAAAQTARRELPSLYKTAMRAGEAATSDGDGVTSAPSRRMYHGTGSAFDRPDAAKFDPNGLYGPGYYLTSDARVASSYADQRDVRGPIDGSLANLRQQLAEATDPSLKRSLENDIVRLENELGRANNAGPNVRAVDMPEGLNLLDVDRVYSRAWVDANITPHVPKFARDKFSRALDGVEAASVDDGIMGHDIFHATSEAMGNSREAAGTVLTIAGFDGVKYAGGKRVPIADDAGRPIEHDATVIFRGSMEKLRNAISGTPFGGFSPAGAAAGMQVGEDENGRPTITGYDPVLGAVAMVAGTLGTKEGRRSAAQLIETGTHVAASMTESDRLKMREFKAEVSPLQPWIDKAQAVRYADMLANVVGRAYDVATGAAHTVELPVLDLLEGLHGDKAALGASRERVKAIVGAIPEAFKAAVDIVLSSDPERSGRLEGGASRSGRPFGNGPVGRAVNLVPDVMAASDDFFKTINGAGAVWAEAYKIAHRAGKDIADVFADPANEQFLASKATRAGEYVTYTGDPGGIPKWLGDGARQPGPTGFLVSLAVPFMRVGANIVTRGTKAAVAPVIGPVEAAWRMAKGDGEGARQALARTELAAGVGLFWWSEWAQGHITTNGPDDPQENAAWRAAGNKPNSWTPLGVGPRVPLGAAGAWGAQAVILVNGFDSAVKNAPLKAQRKLIASGGSAQVRDALVLDPATEQFIQQWIAGAASGMADISYLRGIADFLKKGPTDPGFLARTGSSFVGGDVLNRAGQATDPLQREVAKGGVEQFTDTLKSRVPGLRQTLPVKQGPLGDDVKNPGYGRLLPADEAEVNPSPVLSTMLETGVKPSTPPPAISVDGISVPLERAEQRAYQRYAGEILERYVAKKAAEPAWATYTAAKRQAIVKDIQAEAAKAASLKVQKDIGAAELKRRIREVRGIAPQPIR